MMENVLDCTIYVTSVLDKEAVSSIKNITTAKFRVSSNGNGRDQPGIQKEEESNGAQYGRITTCGAFGYPGSIKLRRPITPVVSSSTRKINAECAKQENT